jgi:indolepyruvate ferredoxin oxidoreductase
MSTLLQPVGPEAALEDRYTLPRGTVILTGVQAALRVVFDQMRRDSEADLRTGSLVSGYPGSPLGGFDLEIARERALTEALNVVHQPGLNEELAATAVWGSQLAPGLPNPLVDGVLGVWYGKGPGADRASDALRHGNFVGAHARGGLLALCGDDPQCKSSTIPSATEGLLSALRMPVLVPGTPQEILDLGLHAVALSRMSGTWVSLKIATNVADAVSSVVVDPERVAPQLVTVDDGDSPYHHVPVPLLLPPAAMEMERTLSGPRIALARAYARANDLNGITVDPPEATLGLVAAGAIYYDLIEALRSLGLDQDALRALGVRVLKLGLVWPLDADIVREFAKGLAEIVVVEEKGPFMETAIRDVLYRASERPDVLGKEDDTGQPLIHAYGALTQEDIARAVGSRILRRWSVESVETQLGTLRRPVPGPIAGAPVRTPYFCSGCPHNSSTDTPDGDLVGAGIGCHAMIAVAPTGKGTVTGLTQMGGEGVQWIGQSPFVESKHMFQNLGDGTFSHSGSLAIRASIAAGVNVTYKLLYNGAVSMTGGQDITGGLSVPAITRLLEAEGVRRTIVTAEDLHRYRGVRLAANAEVRARSQLTKAQKELREIPGVTVLIHDQACAAELRRLRKRGKAPDPPHRAYVNPRVCEGCGDCGRKSHCLSVEPVDTEFGTKTRIDQSSCNKDYSCLEGDCPAFVLVTPAPKKKRAVPPPPADMKQPSWAGTEATLRLIGIGGTGVVTVARVLGMAAHLDGKQTIGLDQTGLAQKGGPVVSDVRILTDIAARASRPGRGGVDCYLGFDLLTATSPTNLAVADRDRTVAVLSTSESPTGAMIGNSRIHFAPLSNSLDAVETVTRTADNVYLDANALSETLFGDTTPANTLVLGAAWQRGLIPISLEAMETAFRLNRAAVERNIAAFHWGRAVVAAPDAIAALLDPPVTAPSLAPEERMIVDSVQAPADSELGRLLEIRVPELVAYQGVRYTQDYVGFVRRVLDAERAAVGTSGAVTEAVARHLYKLMAYKDEYEVARLHLDPREQAHIESEFGAGARRAYQLHPPLLRSLGLNRKLSLGPWFVPGLQALRAMRVVRGTPFDIFGYAHVRRVERRLPVEYRELVVSALPHLGTAYAEVVELCELPDMIRGYEGVKLQSVDAFRLRATELAREITKTPDRPALA